jgi:predicted CoA-binding protein
MKHRVDLEKIKEALKRAGQIAVVGTDAQRSGRVMSPSKRVSASLLEQSKKKNRKRAMPKR